MVLFNNVYKDKSILVTGHTGFKGSWLTMWLDMLGARVIGYSSYLPSNPCNFSVCNLQDRIIHLDGDTRDREKLKKAFSDHRPEIVFHLAAQPLVRQSYNDPILTFETNVMGTINLLECVRTSLAVKAVVIITSDKCYKNVEWVWGYRENDMLGGDDPYSASKACAEIASHSYMKSFFQQDGLPNIATTRAGNVIGGGDWASDRIVPDCIRSLSKGEGVKIRSPYATRPWQHVLEPLSGYLWLGAQLYSSNQLHGEAFNFGPAEKVNQSVQELVELFLSYWGKGSWYIEQTGSEKKENSLLKLSCDKALHLLGWHYLLPFNDTVRLTAEWYKLYHGGSQDIYDLSIRQIEYYISQGIKQQVPWVKDR